MMSMYDMTAANAAAVSKLTLEDDAAIAMYCTGSPGIPAGEREVRLFPRRSLVLIDQGFTHSPVPTANVRDVERGAWTAQNAMSEPWHNPFPVIYCAPGKDADTLSRGGWKGGVWLTVDGHNPELPLTYPGLRIVAVQYIHRTLFDKSVIYDTGWIYGLSVTGYSGFASFGWAPVRNGIWDLEIRRESKVASAPVDSAKTRNHFEMPLSAGTYEARIKLHGYSEWSPNVRFTVS